MKRFLNTMWTRNALVDVVARQSYAIKGGLGGGGNAAGGSGIVIIRYKLKPNGTIAIIR